jgi:hypothetical protein
MLMTIYHLWLARNEAREAVQIEDPNCTASRSFFLLEEWTNSRTAGPVRSTGRVEHWLPPTQGWTKINVDGAFNRDTCHGGGGVVLRDHHGVFLAGACRFFPVCD